MSTLVLHQSRRDTQSPLPPHEHKLGPGTRVLEQRVRQRLLLQRLERQPRPHSSLPGHSHKRKKRRAAGSASSSQSGSQSGSAPGSTSGSPAPSERGRVETDAAVPVHTAAVPPVPKAPRRVALSNVPAEPAPSSPLKRKRDFSGGESSHLVEAPQLQEKPRLPEGGHQKAKKKHKKRKSASPDQTPRETPDVEGAKEAATSSSPKVVATKPDEDVPRLTGAAAEAAAASLSRAVSSSTPSVAIVRRPLTIAPGAAMAARVTPDPTSFGAKQAPKPTSAVAKPAPKPAAGEHVTPKRALRMVMPSGSSSRKGLRNYGNSCYLNSVLQTLLHTAPLVNTCLLDGLRSRSLKGFDPVKALGGLARSALFGGSGAAWPKPFYEHLPKPLRRGRQEDAHEFLRLLLEGMSTSLSPPQAEGKGKKDKPVRTPIQHIFGGRFRSRVTCGTCKSHSDTFDEFADVSVDIASPRIQTLSDALGAFTKPDRLTGGNKYMCEKCKKRSDAVKRFTIHEAPEGVLTLQLKRFDWTGKKVTRPIKFPARLDLSPYMSSGEEATYDLYGIVHHFGHGVKTGHYVASVREASGSHWVRLDDDYVSSYSLNTADPSAYILFYQRRP